MNKLFTGACTIALTFAAAGTAAAQDATQNVDFSVTNMALLTVSGHPAPMSVTAGGVGNTATNAVTTYGITSNLAAAQKIMASLNTVMPTGVTLSTALAAPNTGGATTAGAVVLTATPQLVVGTVMPQQTTGMGITYTLSASVLAAAAANAQRVVTYTLIAQ
jgi:hypothetical protein